MTPKALRPVRHLGTFYYAAPLLSTRTCGHKHATVRAAMKCKRLFPAASKPRIFEALFGRLPAKPLD